MNQGLSAEMVEGEADEPAHRLRRRERFEMQLALPLANFAIGVEKHGRIERLLVAEVVIEQPLVGGGALRDAVDARAVEAELAELGRGRRPECPAW